MHIHSAEFVVSNTDVSKCPQSQLPEFGFIGRSNVGKSSLINMITNKTGLAMTSSKPGKTLLINHFLINKNWHLVDLPGYGYARASKTQRESLRKMVERYVLLREQLFNLFVLIDSRLEPQAIDLEFMNWLGEAGVPFSIVFTKIDKLASSKIKINIQSYKDKLAEEWEELPPIFVTSAEKKIGAEDILKYIEEVLKED